MYTFDPQGGAEGGLVYFQVKSTDDLPLLKDVATISWNVSRRDLKRWLTEIYPVILVVYDGQRDRAFWLHIQKYFADRPTADLFTAGETLNVHLSVTSRIHRRSLQSIVQAKNRAQQDLQN